jgi:hypothetical protein
MARPPAGGTRRYPLRLTNTAVLAVLIVTLAGLALVIGIVVLHLPPPR